MNSKETLGEYLPSLKPGDTIFRMAGGSNLDKQRISRVTTTQIILTSGGRYNRKTGQSIGGPTWNRSNIVLPTPEVRQAWQALYLANWANNLLPGLFKSLTSEQQLQLFRQIQAMATDSKPEDTPASANEDI